MTTVLDASALLALLHDEPGADRVMEVLDGALINTVNWAEVVQKAVARGVPVEGMRGELSGAGLNFEPFSAAQAEIAGRLWLETRDLGLSLGDRACLALASDRALPVLTADREWSRLSIPVEIRLIR